MFSQQSFDYVKGSCIILWQAPSNNGSPITSYTLLKDVGSGVFYTVYQGTDTSFTDTELVEGESYNYKIYATNGAGSGPVSSMLTAIAGAEPGKITSVTIGLQSQTTLTINYAAPEDTGGLTITSYLILTDEGNFIYNAALSNALALTYTKAIT